MHRPAPAYEAGSTLGLPASGMVGALGYDPSRRSPSGRSRALIRRPRSPEPTPPRNWRIGAASGTSNPSSQRWQRPTLALSYGRIFGGPRANRTLLTRSCKDRRRPSGRGPINERNEIKKCSSSLRPTLRLFGSGLPPNLPGRGASRARSMAIKNPSRVRARRGLAIFRSCCRMLHSGCNPSIYMRVLPIGGDHRIGNAHPAEPQRVVGSGCWARYLGGEQHGQLDDDADDQYQEAAITCGFAQVPPSADDGCRRRREAGGASIETKSAP